MPYYDACVRDTCGCDSGGDCECMCDAVAAYAKACLDVGVCVDWRAPDFCRKGSTAQPQPPSLDPLLCFSHYKETDLGWMGEKPLDKIMSKLGGALALGEGFRDCLLAWELLLPTQAGPEAAKVPDTLLVIPSRWSEPIDDVGRAPWSSEWGLVVLGYLSRYGRSRGAAGPPPGESPGCSGWGESRVNPRK